MAAPSYRASKNITGTDNWYLTLLPEQLPFISYGSMSGAFDMLRDAALLYPKDQQGALLNMVLY